MIDSEEEVSEQLIVVPIMKVFDIIHESRRSMGHLNLSEEKTAVIASKKC